MPLEFRRPGRRHSATKNQSAAGLRRRQRRLWIEQLESRYVPTTVGPGKFSGTISSNTEFNSTTGTYEINGALTIQAGVTLTVDPGVTVLIDPGVTVTDNGSLTIGGLGNAATIEAADTGGPMGIIVNNQGSLSANGATFSIQNGTDASAAALLQVTSGGSMSATGCEFAWDNVTFACGHNGYGLLLAAAADFLAEYIVTGQLTERLRPFLLERFHRLG